MQIAGYEFDAARVKGHAMVLFGTLHEERHGDSELRFKVAAALTKIKEVIIGQLKADVPIVKVWVTLGDGRLSFGFVDHAKTLEKETRVISMGGESEHNPETCPLCQLDRSNGARESGGKVPPGCPSLQSG